MAEDSQRATFDRRGWPRVRYRVVGAALGLALGWALAGLADQWGGFEAGSGPAAAAATADHDGHDHAADASHGTGHGTANAEQAATLAPPVSEARWVVGVFAGFVALLALAATAKIVSQPAPGAAPPTGRQATGH